MQRRRWFVLYLALVILVYTVFVLPSTWEGHVGRDVRLTLDGKVVQTQPAAVLVDGRLTLAVDVVEQELGGWVVFDGKEGLAMQLGSKVAKLSLGQTLAQVDGKTVDLDTVPQLMDDTLFVPLSLVAELAELEVHRSRIFSSVAMARAPVADDSQSAPAVASVSEVPVMSDRVSASMQTNGVSRQAVGEAALDQGAGSTRLVVPVSGPVGVEGTWITSPERLVLNLEPAVLDSGSMDAVVDDSLVNRLQVNQVGLDVVRVTLHLDTSLPIRPVSRILTDRDLDQAGLHWAGRGSQGLAVDVSRLVMQTTEVVPSGSLVQLFRGSSRPGQLTVVVDPGHGGRNLGAVGPQGTMEKQHTLTTGLLLAAELEAQGIRVILTRYGDHDVPNPARIALANALEADAFVSLHYNACPGCVAQGTETYYSRRGPRSEELARRIHHAVLAATGLPDREVRLGHWTVLNRATVPAILLEIGFMNSRAAEELVNDPDFQHQAARGIARGLMEFLGAQEDSGSTQTVDAANVGSRR